MEVDLLDVSWGSIELCYVRYNCRFVWLSVCVRVQESVICVPVPLYHCFGMVMACLQVPVWGTKCVFPSAQFDPAEALQAIQHEKYVLSCT